MRPILDNQHVTPGALHEMQSFHPAVLSEVMAAISRDPVVVLGMSGNPHVKAVKKALEEAGIKFTYLEYGSYVSEWKKRLAIKLWSGWPTFPQVFVKGTLLGGSDLTKAALADGSLQHRLR